MKQSTDNHLGILDGVRGLLAFWVFFFHLEVACIKQVPPWGPGDRAVDVFMLLSGFLMAFHWEKRRRRFDGFRRQTFDFYVRRFFRIAPLYYLLLTVALFGRNFFLKTSTYVYGNRYTPVVDTGVSDVLAHFSFLFGFFPAYSSNNILPDWSIGLEMQFYLFFPLMMVVLRRCGPFSTVITLTLVAFVTNMLIGLYGKQGVLGTFPQPSLILFKVNIFTAGICLAFAYLYRANAKAVPWLLLGAVSLATTALQVIAFAFFIAFMLFFDGEKTDLFHRMASSRVARFFGDTSYSVYLLHTVIMYPVLYALFHYRWFLDLQPYPRLLVSFILIAVPVYGTSFLLLQFVERPGIALGRRLLRRKKAIADADPT